MANSMKLQEHIFLATKMPAVAWGKRTENVEGFNSLSALVKATCPNATFNVFEAEGEEEPGILRFRLDEKGSALTITQYNTTAYGELPWASAGAITTDRSSEYFIYVCAHSTRDARCAFCGAVLVDLLRKAIVDTMGEEALKRISVRKCSHVGGHIYAGNVLVYSRFGGVCFGLFKPADVDTLVGMFKDDQGVVPASLRGRIRGQLLTSSASMFRCNTM
ncbi:hypothetical protein STCU_02627 [Strigomonas culicis]|nr:hypothetical protein STCU_02627 [Strigomonas culicis]|eukprot:EPY32818.1 hypothetical protein STCU_02627 [Strigomonas culicis]